MSVHQDFVSLFKAVRGGEVQKVRDELSKCKDPVHLLNRCTQQGVTLLMLASSRGDLETVELLVEKGAELDKLHNDNFNASGSALMKAVRANQAETVELLLRLGADIDLINSFHYSALAIACRGDNSTMVEILLSRGATCNPSRGVSPLYAASESEKGDIVKILLEKKARVSGEALKEACSKGNKDIVNALLQNESCGEDEINFMVNGGWSPLMAASDIGRDDIVKLLLSHGASIDAENTGGDYALLLAIKKGHISTTKLLLEKGASCCNLKKIALIEVIYLVSRSNSMKKLIDKDEDVIYEDVIDEDEDVIDEDVACSLIELLLGHYTDVNIVSSSYGNLTPLLIALPGAPYPVIKLLVDRGADVNFSNSLGITPLMYASTKDIARLLLEKGAIIDEVDNQGRSALRHMVENKHYDASDLLLSEEANYNLRDDTGRRPVDILRERLGIQETDTNSPDVLAMNKQLMERQQSLFGGLQSDIHPLSMANLHLLKYRRDGNIEEFRLMNRVSAKWRKFGILLKITHNDLDGFDKKCRGDTEDCWTMVMQRWLDGSTSGYDITWEGLYQLLNDLQLPEVATDLKKAVDS